MHKDFRKSLSEEILLADGAIGTLLDSRGATSEQAKSPLNLTDATNGRTRSRRSTGRGCAWPGRRPQAK